MLETTSSTPVEQQSIKPWSGNATLWLGLLILVSYLVITGFNVGFVSAFLEPESTSQTDAEHLMNQLVLDGDFNAGNYLFLTVIFAPILLWLGKKRSAVSGANYLGFSTLPSKKVFLQFNGLLIAYFIFTYVMSDLLAIETPKSMIDLYNTTDYFLLAIIAVVFCAPLLEEMFFRGFLFKGWQASRLGTVGAIVITSVLFTLIHAGQYDFTMLAMLSTLAFILGFARYKSGGIWLPIYLHFVNNALSSVEMYFLMN